MYDAIKNLQESQYGETSEPPRDKTNKMACAPSEDSYQPVWSESSLCAQWVANDPSFLPVDNEDSDQTGRMPRLIWVFAGHTCHFVGFWHEVAHLIIRSDIKDNAYWACIQKGSFYKNKYV